MVYLQNLGNQGSVRQTEVTPINLLDEGVGASGVITARLQ